MKKTGHIFVFLSILQSALATLDLCGQQYDCLQWTMSEPLVSSRCSYGECEYKVCITTSFEGNCSKQTDESFTNACGDTGNDCAEPSTCTGWNTKLPNKQTLCQYGAGGSDLLFVIQDGTSCNGEGAFNPLGDSVAVTCSSEGAPNVCRGLAGECVWRVSLPSCPVTEPSDSNSPQPSPSTSEAASNSPEASGSPEASASPQPSDSSSSSPSPTARDSDSPSDSPLASESPATASPSESEQPSPSPEATGSESPSEQPSESDSPSGEPSASISPEPASLSPSPSEQPSESPSPSESTSPSTSPSEWPSNSIEPTPQPSDSASGSSSDSPSPLQTPSPVASESVSRSTSRSRSPSRSPPATRSPSRSPQTRSPSPSPRRTVSPSRSPSASKSTSQSPQPSRSSSQSPKPSPSTSPVASTSPLPSASPSPLGVCVDFPIGWTDSQGDGCDVYISSGWCTPAGKIGSRWNIAWGSLGAYKDANGVSATTACCGCGGGARDGGICSAGEWGAWSSCSATCGGGIQTRERTVHSGGPSCPGVDTAVCNPTPCSCEDRPLWVDKYGATCATYAEMNYCNSSSGYGEGWQAEWGTFADRGVDGVDATMACCGCGSDACITDTVMVVDRSGSITVPYWQIVAKYMFDRINQTSFSGPSGNRMGVVAFSTRSSVVCPMTHVKATLLDCIEHILYTGGFTFMADAINLGGRHLDAYSLPGRTRVMEVVTDGESTNAKALTQDAAAAQKRKGVIMLAIGIGLEANDAELEGIASEPKASHWANLGSFTALNSLSKIITQSCIPSIPNASNITWEKDPSQSPLPSLSSSSSPVPSQSSSASPLPSKSPAPSDAPSASPKPSPVPSVSPIPSASPEANAEASASPAEPNALNGPATTQATDTEVVGAPSSPKASPEAAIAQGNTASPPADCEELSYVPPNYASYRSDATPGNKCGIEVIMTILPEDCQRLHSDCYVVKCEKALPKETIETMYNLQCP